MTQKSLQINQLTKTYKGQKSPAVCRIQLDVYEGEIFGLLGLNGAGKSTMFKCVAGILPFDSGSISVCGYDILKDEIAAKSSLAFIPDNHAVFEELTGNEYIGFMADMYKVDKSVRLERKQKFASMLNMTDMLNRQIKSYSHGMKQKIAIIGGIIHHPRLWIMDEPFVGIDPISLSSIEDFMREYVKLGNTIIFSSHIMELVSSLCGRMGIVHGGSLIKIQDTVPTSAEVRKIFLDCVEGK